MLELETQSRDDPLCTSAHVGRPFAFMRHVTGRPFVFMRHVTGRPFVYMRHVTGRHVEVKASTILCLIESLHLGHNTTEIFYIFDPSLIC